MESVRLRLRFENRHILTQTQKSEGLKRSWILLKPELETISDLASYLTHTFDLQHTCPNGIILSMDGFVLPSFESTRIFQDKDIVRLKRKEGDVIKIGDDADFLEDSEIVGRQPVTGGNLLAIEEFEKETGGYQSEPEENEYDIPETASPLETPSRKATSKKRKSSTKLHTAKRKKVRCTSPEQSPRVPIEGVDNDEQENNQFSKKSSYENDSSPKTNSKSKKACTTAVSKVDGKSVKKKRIRFTPEKSSKLTVEGVLENDGPANNQDCNHMRALSRKSSYIKGMSSKTSTKLRTGSVSDVGNGVENSIEHMHNEDRNSQHQENMENTIPEGTEKRGSRSARRKKAQRKRFREFKNSQGNEVLLVDRRVNQSPIQNTMLEESMHNKSELLQESSQNCDLEAEIVPIVVKPGHIRFEPIDEDQVSRQSLDPMATFQWNGTLSKKKGQKWGMEKTSVSRSIGYEDNSKVSWGKTTIEEGEILLDSVDFEKLNPLSGSPKEGDKVAYRLLELSTSWCPELSPFRVGKVSWFDSASNKIILVPVPGFPVGSDEKGENEANDEQSGSSLYREDGSLEIDFTSLVDVRIFSFHNLDTASTVTDVSKKAPASIKDAGPSSRFSDNHEEATVVTEGSTETPVNKARSSPLLSNVSNGETQSPFIGNGKHPDVWEEISRALNEKKSQLSKEDSWSKKVSSGSNRGFYKGFRSGAIGPTMSLLRAGSGKRS